MWVFGYTLFSIARINDVSITKVEINVLNKCSKHSYKINKETTVSDFLFSIAADLQSATLIE